MLPIGSILSTPPDKTYIEKSFYYMQWKIKDERMDSDEWLMLIKKKLLNEYRKTIIWIEIMKEVFPEKIVEDAKRFAFDLKPTGFLKKCAPSFYGILCYYMACKFHGFDFESVFDRVLELKGRGREVFGLKKKTFVIKEKQLQMLRKYAEEIEIMMPDKFRNLKEMYKEIGGKV